MDGAFVGVFGVDVRRNGVARRERRWRGGRTWMRVQVGVGQRVKDRYELKEQLGKGATSVTFSATDVTIPDGEDVVVKVLSLRETASWKAMELFEREARTLSSINHPSIPGYIDSFYEDSEDDRQYFLVQKRAPGRSLQSLVDSDWRATTEQVSQILEQLLVVLEYLDSLSPPVVHRDIKPSNIIVDVTRTGDAELGARVSVVDFGAVVADTKLGEGGLGSTMIGTFGYMAPEQFSGAATTSTDLYGVGATMIYLLTRSEPSALPLSRLRIAFEEATRTRYSSSPKLARVIAVVSKLTEPTPEDRFRTATEALDALRGSTALERVLPDQVMGKELARICRAKTPSPPKGSRLVVGKDATSLRITIPSAGVNAETVSTGAFALTWNGIIGVFTAGALSSGAVPLALFSMPFWLVGSQLLSSAAKGFTEEIDITVDIQQRTVRVHSKSIGNETVDVLEIDQIEEVKVIVEEDADGYVSQALDIVEGAKTFRVAQQLPPADLRFLQGHILNYVRAVQAVDVPPQVMDRQRLAAFDADLNAVKEVLDGVQLPSEDASKR